MSHQAPGHCLQVYIDPTGVPLAGDWGNALVCLEFGIETEVLVSSQLGLSAPGL